MDLNSTATTARPGVLDFDNLTGWSHTLQTIAIASLVFAVCTFLPNLQYKAQLAKIPIFGGPGSGEKQRQSYLNSAKKIYSDGYEKVRWSST